MIGASSAEKIMTSVQLDEAEMQIRKGKMSLDLLPLQAAKLADPTRLNGGSTTLNGVAGGATPLTLAPPALSPVTPGPTETPS